MTYTYETRQDGDSFAFRIFDDTGTVVAGQNFKPYEEGFQPMTENEAAHYAERMIDNMKTTAPESPPRYNPL